MAFDPARVKSLFLQASDLPSPEERAAYLDRECGGEPDLRARVEALLAVEGRAGPVPGPEATGVFQPAPAEGIEATQRIAPETVQGSWVSDQDPGLATVGASSAGGEPATLAAVPSVARIGGFVPGQVIGGRYTLLEVLGEGGMGTVYRAEQSQPVRRMVALKLIKVGMDSRSVLARFDAERQALALMDHPNIAQVYDGGATDAGYTGVRSQESGVSKPRAGQGSLTPDPCLLTPDLGQPFFVMEFVRGVPITDYCDRNRLSVDARLDLFVAVCQAVQHAHQKGIIHRDLKPGNVMVTEVDGRPTPKVIDFGVAKATESSLIDQSLGDTGAIVGTPTYMSPEQADPSSMDIDTRTDIYALGVILYELLAGSPPLDATQFKRGALLEMLRMVREVDPSKPSMKASTSDALPSIAANRGIDPERLKRALRGDLDWIVMKALEKDRTRRYATANGLGADILRHLASEPVLAAPPSRAYRLRKFVRKHRAGVIAASLVLLALVAGVTGTTLGLLEAGRQETLANERAEGERIAKQKALEAAAEERKAKETVEDVLGFVENRIFAAARPKNQAGGLGYDVKLADAVTAALPSIEKSFPDRPLTEARLRRTIGLSFAYLGKPELAAKQFEAARSLSGRYLGLAHPGTLNTMNYLANSYRELGRFAEALALSEETVALTKAKLGPDHRDTLASMNNLANSYRELGRYAEALKLREETVALMKAKLGADHPDTFTSMNNLAITYVDLGRYAEALKLNEETLALTKAKLGADHLDTLRGMHNLAITYVDLGRHAEALKLNEETLALMKAKLGADHPATLRTMNELAISYAALGRHAEALKLREETLALTKAKFGADHPATLSTMNNLANSYAALGRHAEALKLREETLALRKAKLGADHPDTIRSMGTVAASYLAAGRVGEALSLLKEGSHDKNHGAASSRTLGSLQVWLGQDEEYGATRKRALALAKGTNDAAEAHRATQAAALRPSTDPAELEAVLALGRKAVGLNKGEWELLALGMGEFRNGHLAAADEALLAATKAGRDVKVAGIADFYRAMSLFRQDKKDEARDVATKAAALMRPLPKDERNPLLNDPDTDHLLVWLAYKEARTLIGFDAPPRRDAEARREVIASRDALADADFFKAKIGNLNTRKAYERALDRFLGWCRLRGLALRQVTSFVVGDYVEHHLLDQDGHPLAAPTKKQHLAGLRHFFDNQRMYHGVGINPAS